MRAHTNTHRRSITVSKTPQSEKKEPKIAMKRKISLLLLRHYTGAVSVASSAASSSRTSSRSSGIGKNTVEVGLHQEEQTNSITHTHRRSITVSKTSQSEKDNQKLPRRGKFHCYYWVITLGRLVLLPLQQVLPEPPLAVLELVRTRLAEDCTKKKTA